MAKILVQLFFLTVAITLSLPAHAQVRFHTSAPIIDSFPIVKADVSVSVAGRPAPFDKSHLSILEDGVPITNYEFVNCQDANTASVAVLVDVSESMVFTLYTGDDEYYQSFRDFINKFGPGSEVALLPFNDTVARIIPPHYSAGKEYFDTGDPNDVQEFIDSVGGLLFLGRTDVDFAVWTAVQHLKKAKNERRSIVLVTDDAIYNSDGLIALLRQEDITLFVMEMDGDTIRGNIETANGSGGKFFSAKDSNYYSPIMTEIADLIFTKRCQVRYVSQHPCPWWSQKTLWFGLNYQNANLSQTHYFQLGRNLHDSLPPLLTETKISDGSRRIRAEEDFPCQRGIKVFQDSALTNFAKVSRVRDWPDMAYDSIAVIDPSQPASGYYIAIDSSGNRTMIYVSYTPGKDELPPVWSVPFRKTPDQFQLTATELRKGDKGLKSISLVPGSMNLRLDSVVYSSHRIAQVYVSRIDPKLEATGCVIAIDSVDNDSNACVVFTIDAKDVNPPVITQRAVASPYLRLVADITELKALDEGIQSISVTPITNVTAANVGFTSAFIANADLGIVDSLYIAEAIVTAMDSAGNSSQLTLTYAPQPDTKSPVGAVTIVDAISRTVTITEEQPWDRGLKLVTLVQSTNVSPILANESRRLNSWSITSVDPFVAGIARFEAQDSAGNISSLDVEIPAQMKPEPKPLTYTDPLDFGTVVAPSYSKQIVQISNPNDEPIRLTGGTWAKDDSVFNLVESYPLTVPAKADLVLSFEFEPQLLGDWTGIYTFETEGGAKYPIVMTGRSTGAIHVDVSNESVALSGDKGTIKVKLSGSPSISNADSIAFELVLNKDLATLESPSSDCANSNWLCNYDLTWRETSDGYALQLLRKSPTQSLVLSSGPVIEIPFNTFITTEPSTTVRIEQGLASRSIVTATNGSITVGEACGDPLIRNVLRAQAGGSIQELISDKAADALLVRYHSSDQSSLALQVVDVAGGIVREVRTQVNAGSNDINMKLNGLPSGRYQLLARTKFSVLSQPFTVVR